VVLEKDGEDQLDRSCDKCRSITQSLGRDEHAINRRKTNWIVHILGKNCLRKHVIERKIGGTGDKKEDVSSCWMTLSKKEDTGN
jgi:hypothetical protein